MSDNPVRIHMGMHRTITQTSVSFQWWLFNLLKSKRDFEISQPYKNIPAPKGCHNLNIISFNKDQTNLIFRVRGCGNQGGSDKHSSQTELCLFMMRQVIAITKGKKLDYRTQWSDRFFNSFDSVFPSVFLVFAKKRKIK